MNQILAFCDYLSHQKRYSTHTIVAYKKDLEQFYHFIKTDFDTHTFKNVTSPIVRSWIVHLIEKETSTRTVNRKISTLKSFYKYLLKNNQIISNPILKVITPKTSKRLPIFLKEKETQDLFHQIKFENNFEGKRDRLILDFFYNTGIRLSELVELKVSSIDTKNSTIKVIGKRNKERIIPISKNLEKELTLYLEERELIPSQSPNLFLTKKGEKIYQKLVYRTVNYYLSSITTVEQKSPHVLRHTFATHMLNNGADLNAIKEILGHTNLSATQVYTHNTIEKLKNIHQQAHPKA